MEGNDADSPPTHNIETIEAMDVQEGDLLLNEEPPLVLSDLSALEVLGQVVAMKQSVGMESPRPLDVEIMQQDPPLQQQMSPRQLAMKQQIDPLSMVTDDSVGDDGVELINNEIVHPIKSLPSILNCNSQISSTTPTTTAAAITTTTPAAATSLLTTNTVDSMEEVRSEGTFSFQLKKFSELKNSSHSPPYFIRNLPWKLMLMKRTDKNPDTFTLGVFLQCDAQYDTPNWSCFANAELRLKSVRQGVDDFVKTISHVFSSKENDWGFTTFMSWDDVLNPEKGYILDDTIEVSAYVKAEAPHGCFWDSKLYTGYIGLKNQGATCYMNSLLQTLFFTNELRKAVYKMPTEADDCSKSVALALQRVFYDLQFNKQPVGTKKLTTSFGWETMDSFMQHDVQEFLRVLLDKLENKMKGTCFEGTVPRLFGGQMSSYVKCKNVDYTSTRLETFYDIQLNVKNKKNIYDSLRDYIATENLDGDNKYDAGDHGLQDAEKGVIFVSFPPVLYLHLMRFQYDPITDNSMKCNDRFEFTEHICLTDFLQKTNKTQQESTLTSELPSNDIKNPLSSTTTTTTTTTTPSTITPPITNTTTTTTTNLPNQTTVDASGFDVEADANYTLHAVLVHSGDNHGGHYVVYINPTADGRWCKFDDDVVSTCKKIDAIEYNFGGPIEGDMNFYTKPFNSNAYMLVYIRDTAIKRVLQPIPESEIPEELRNHLDEERRMEQVRREERNDINNVMDVCVRLEEFLDDTGNLFELNKRSDRVFRMKKQDSIEQLLDRISKAFRTPTKRMRLWQLNKKTSKTTNRLSLLDHLNCDQPIFSFASLQNPWTIFLELLPPDSLLMEMPPFCQDQDIILFFKYYDPAEKRLSYIGLEYLNLNQTSANCLPIMNRLIGLPICTPLTLYKEININKIQRIDNQNDTWANSLMINNKNLDSATIIFEKSNHDVDYELPTCQDYINNLLDHEEVAFIDKNIQLDPGFTLHLSKRLNYKQITIALGRYLNVHPERLQLLKNFPPGQHLAKTAVESTSDDCLDNIYGPQKKLFYQRLPMNITEFESRKHYSCQWFSLNMKEEKELHLYPPKTGTVTTLLEEAAKIIEFNSELGSGKLRFFEVIELKISPGPSHDEKLEKYLSYEENIISSTKHVPIQRIEEIPRDELELGPDEQLIPVSRFHKEGFTCYTLGGHPFYIKVKQGEAVGVLKERIQKKLCLSDKEWEKYKLALLPSQTQKPEYLEEDSKELHLNNTFRLNSKNGTRTILGLEHVNKNQKRTRFNYLEKAIKIYN